MAGGDHGLVCVRKWVHPCRKCILSHTPLIVAASALVYRKPFLGFGGTRTVWLSSSHVQHGTHNGTACRRCRCEPGMGTVPGWGTAVGLASLLPGFGMPAEQAARPGGAERSGASARAAWK